MISSDQLHIEELRLRYLELLERPDVFPTVKNWEFITENRMQGLGKALYHKFLIAHTIDDNDREGLHDVAITEFPKYLGAIGHREAVETVYSDITTLPGVAEALIRENLLFDAPKLLEILHTGNLNFVINVLDVYQPDYDIADYLPMKELLEELDGLPTRGSIETKSGIFGSSEKYICPNGHTNSTDTEYCTHSGCGLNMRGLTQAQEKKIDLYSKRVEALASILEQAGYALNH